MWAVLGGCQACPCSEAWPAVCTRCCDGHVSPCCGLGWALLFCWVARVALATGRRLLSDKSRTVCTAQPAI